MIHFYAKEVIDSINGKINSTINPIILDSHHECSCFPSVEFLFARTTLNEAAHVLAEYYFKLGMIILLGQLYFGLGLELFASNLSGELFVTVFFPYE